MKYTYKNKRKGTRKSFPIAAMLIFLVGNKDLKNKREEVSLVLHKRKLWLQQQQQNVKNLLSITVISKFIFNQSFLQRI